MKPIILIFIQHYVPGFRMGGPLRSVSSLVDALGNEFSFRIITSDRDLGDEVGFQNIPTNQWVTVGNSRVYYATPAFQSLFRVARLIHETPHDILYLNSFFAKRFSFFPLCVRWARLSNRTPLIVAPRGEFSAGALSLKKRKKWLYIAAARSAGLCSDVLWQASSEREAADIRAVMGDKVAIQIAPNVAVGVGVSGGARGVGTAQYLRVAFVGRISPMKNLDYALRVLARVTKPVAFSIIGPVEDESYYAKCQRLAVELPAHVQVCWRGAVPPATVPAVLGEHDLLFLPTRGENFGHVVFESLSAGTPVLLSDATPWRGLGKVGVGWDLPLSDPMEFATVIDSLATQDSDAWARQRERVLQFAVRYQHETNAVDANRALFYSALPSRR